MAGDTPDFESEMQKAGQLPPASARPRKVKVISCPRCGSSVTIRNPGASLSVVCDACKSLLDAQDANFRILDTCARATKNFQPLIPLGARAQLFGKLWECIGFCARRDGGYSWEEYLLFNPYYGYRWLVNLSGHWNFVRSIKDTPKLDYSGKTATLDGKKYSLFNRGNAVYDFVQGEFYWNVHVDESVSMEDFISPPYMLSSEKSGQDIVWSIGEYVEHSLVAKAFNLKSFRKPSGVGANQLTGSQREFASIKKSAMVLFGLLTLAQIVSFILCANKSVDVENFTFSPNKKGSVNSRVFKIEKDKANADLSFVAPVDNSWLWISGALVNNDTGLSFPFEKSIEYYHGHTDGEDWSEGSIREELGFSHVPAGNYYVSMDYESGSFKDTGDNAYRMTVSSDVPDSGNYFICLLLLSVFPVLYSFAVYGDNVKRWSESDFTPALYRQGES